MTQALLLMDFQNGIVARHNASDALANAGRALATARERGTSVIFVRVAFRAGHPEISPGNKAFARGLVRYSVDADAWGKRGGRLFIAAGDFDQKGSFGGDDD